MFEVWRNTNHGLTLVRSFRWRWLTRLFAWEHTKRGWFGYVVIPSERNQERKSP